MTFQIGAWTIEFPNEYRIVADGTSAVVLDEEKNALILISIAESGSMRIERTYYAMICEIDADQHKAKFLLSDEIA